jgi:S1-C subfamily serine protease
LFAIIIRVALRSESPRIRYAWTAFLSTLLIVSGFLTSAAAVLLISLRPLPAVVGTITSSASTELDERQQFPNLPSAGPMDSVEISQHLKPLVVVVTPAQHFWIGRQVVPGNYYGAGLLLQADDQGYLFATARHVVDGGKTDGASTQALVATASGIWTQAEVAARHQKLDLVLLWVPRHSGHGSFTQPIAQGDDGEQIYVIGHPEGLKFTLSNGIISRLDGDLVQISAPVSPGNSGGPVYDSRGNLLGVVTAKMDHTVDPNAENLNFAISAGALANASGWNFVGNGRETFDRFLNANQALHASTPQ